MRIYVASSWRNKRLDKIVAELREAGHEVFDFRETRGFSWSKVDPGWQKWSA